MEPEAQVTKRDRVVQEIIATERTYVNRLTLLCEIYIEPLRKQEIISEMDIQAIFSNLQIIQGFNKALFRDLEAAGSSQSDNFGALFRDFAPYFRMYSSYLNNYESAMDRRAELMTKNSAFARFVEQAQLDPRATGLGIADLLIEPVQRIPRYKMLLEQLQKYTPEDHTDYVNIASALESVSSAAMHNNEMIRRREAREQILQIMMQFEASTRINLLDTPSRTFIREGSLQKLCRRGPKDFYFWLFNDKILYGEPATGGKYRLNREIRLEQCRIGPVEHVQNTDKAFMIESPQKSFIVWARDPRDKADWMLDITTAMEKRRETIQEETGKIAPVWTPDNAVSACEICTSKFTMMFRRHHCRQCGSIVCANCSSHKFRIDNIDSNKDVRVCDPCYAELVPDSVTASAPAPLAKQKSAFGRASMLGASPTSPTASAPAPSGFAPAKPPPKSKPRPPPGTSADANAGPMTNTENPLARALLDELGSSKSGRLFDGVDVPESESPDGAPPYVPPVGPPPVPKMTPPPKPPREDGGHVRTGSLGAEPVALPMPPGFIHKAASADVTSRHADAVPLFLPPGFGSKRETTDEAKVPESPSVPPPVPAKLPSSPSNADLASKNDTTPSAPPSGPPPPPLLSKAQPPPPPLRPVEVIENPLDNPLAADNAVVEPARPPPPPPPPKVPSPIAADAVQNESTASQVETKASEAVTVPEPCLPAPANEPADPPSLPPPSTPVVVDSPVEVVQDTALPSVPEEPLPETIHQSAEQPSAPADTFTSTPVETEAPPPEPQHPRVDASEIKVDTTSEPEQKPSSPRSANRNSFDRAAVASLRLEPLVAPIDASSPKAGDGSFTPDGGSTLHDNVTTGIVKPIAPQKMKRGVSTRITSDAPKSAPAPAMAPVVEVLPEGPFYPYAELTSSNASVPAGVDASQRELYLTDEEFIRMFECTKQEFRSMPKWKQTQKKKALNLF